MTENNTQQKSSQKGIHGKSVTEDLQVYFSGLTDLIQKFEEYRKLPVLPAALHERGRE